MKDIKIIFDFDQEVTFSQFSNLIYHMNSAFNMSKRIDNILAEKLFNVDEFSEYNLSIWDAYILTTIGRRSFRVGPNSPLKKK